MPVLDWYVVRGTLLPFLDRSSVRQAAFGTVLAMLVSYSAILTLGFGFIGSSGNSIATGALLFALLALLFLLSFRGELHPRAADLFYAGYAAVALLSFLIIADAPTREHLLLVATLSGYVACRSLVASDIQVARSAFERITAVIVLVGAFVTAVEIFRQWDGEPGKPMVFGFNAAGTYFMMALGFSGDRPLDGRQTQAASHRCNLSIDIYPDRHLRCRHRPAHIPGAGWKHVRCDHFDRARKTLAPRECRPGDCPRDSRRPDSAL